MIQFGAESNWQSLAGETVSSVILLKRDGTLWHWGTNGFNQITMWSQGNNYFNSKNYKGLRAFTPSRLGVESNWTRLLRGNRWSYAWQRDGLAWALHDVEQKGSLQIELVPGNVFERVPEFDHVQFRSLNSSDAFFPIEMGVRDDGTLWYWYWYMPLQRVMHFSPGLVQIGKDSHWAGVAAGHNQVLGLKTDGSIWRWDLKRADTKTWLEFLQKAPKRLGTHQDWVALAYWLNDSVALAADGTLWSWRSSDPVEGWKNGSLLAPSRRPAKIENILDAREW
jgi:alpha-tubulin suppressor-like RCC1 family protein